MAAALFMCSSLSALLLSWSSLTPNGRLGRDAYDLTFAIHGRLMEPFVNAFTLLLLSVASPLAARDVWRGRIFLATLGLSALEALSIAALVFGLPTPIANAEMHLTIAAVSACLVWGSARSLPGNYVGAALLLGAALGAWFLGVREDCWFLLCMLGLSSRWAEGGAGSLRDPRYSVKREQLLALGAPLAFRSLIDSPSLSVPLSVLWAVGTVWLLVLVWKRIKPPMPLPVRNLARAGLVLFTLHALLRAFLRGMSVEVHLHDTLFVAASNHAGYLGIALMALASAVRELPDLSAPPRALLLGTTLWLAGAVGFVYSLCLLGTRGNPSRYFRYLPEFTDLHRVASLSTLVLTVGVFVVTLALTRRARGRAE